MARRDADNLDFIKGITAPRFSYTFTGSQWGSSQDEENGKRPTDASPIIVSDQPPGAFADDDDAWRTVYGASKDAIIGLFNGKDLNDNITESFNNYQGVYTAMPIAGNYNLYDFPLGIQQIQYVVSKETVSEAKTASTYGFIEDARSVALRSPAHMVGWGKTITMRPTDPDPTVDPRDNDNEHKLARETWKSAPIDIRWDSRRAMWATWNDLIADWEDKNMGTFVFSTNPDDACGFPFLRGKLEDVWKVLKTSDSDPDGRDNDTDKSGEVCTHLGHKVYDTAHKAAAPLWDVFIVPDGDFEATCGSETTKTGGTANSPPSEGVEGAPGQGTLRIRTNIKYHYSDDYVGPVAFTSQAFDEEEEKSGFMKLVDGVWVPTVEKFKFCKDTTYVDHLETLVKNSKNVSEDGVFQLQEFICNWNDPYTSCILEHFEWIENNTNNFDKALNEDLDIYLKSNLSTLASRTSSAMAQGLLNLKNSIIGTIRSVVAQIQQCFLQLEVSCPIEINEATFSVPPISVSIDEFNAAVQEPPNCTIDSFSDWQGDTGSFLRVKLTDPCGKDFDLTSSCAAPGV